MYRFRTGIPALDKVLNGGIPCKVTVAVMNDPESDASMFCQQLCWQGLVDGETCVYVTYDNHPDVVRENMKRFGWDVERYERDGNFLMIDCFTARIGERSRERYWLERPFDLKSLMGIVRRVEVYTHRLSMPTRVFLDSFSTIALNINFLDVVRFVLKLQGLAKTGTYVGFGVVHKGIHGVANEQIARHVSDGVIDLYTRVEKGGLRHYIRVVKMALTDFIPVEIPYRVTEKGIKALRVKHL